MVLEKEVQRCQPLAEKADLNKKSELNAFFLERIEYIQMVIENIEAECEGGQLTPEEYSEKVQEYI